MNNVRDYFKISTSLQFFVMTEPTHFVTARNEAKRKDEAVLPD